MATASFGTTVQWGSGSAVTAVRSVDFTGSGLNQVDVTHLGSSKRSFVMGIDEARTATVVCTTHPASWTFDNNVEAGLALTINWGGVTASSDLGNFHLTDLQIAAGMDAAIEYTFTFSEV